MSVRALGTQVIKLAYMELKPLGFTKSGAMLTRDKGNYLEHFLVEGSRWNSGEEPWCFTIEVGVFFPELPPFKDANGIWRHCHAVGNAIRLSTKNARDFEVTATTINKVAKEAVSVVLAASSVLPSLISLARPRAEQGLISPLPVPSTWLEAR